MGQGTRSSDTFQGRHAGGLHQCNPRYEASVDEGVGKRNEDNGQRHDRIWGSQSSFSSTRDLVLLLFSEIVANGKGGLEHLSSKKSYIENRIAQVRGHLQPSNSTCYSAHICSPSPIDLGFGYRAERSILPDTVDWSML